MGAITILDVLTFDVETTGLPAKGLRWEYDFEQFPNIVSIAWNYQGVEKDYIIKPDGWEVSQEAAEIHGITTEIALEKGTPFAIVIDEFLQDAEKAILICAHNVYFDVSTIKANVLNYKGRQYYEEMADRSLDKGKRIDTMMKTIKFVGALRANGSAGKFPTLGELFNKLFPGETFDAHKSLADVQALTRCLCELVKLEIIELKIKEYPGDGTQIKIDYKKKAPVKKTIGAIKFEDPNPVTEKSLFDAAAKESEAEPQTMEKQTNKLLDENEF